MKHAAALLLLACIACRRPPPAPASVEPAYRPALQVSALRIAHALVDGGSDPRVDRTERLTLAAPRTVDTVAVQLGSRWVVAAVERDRVTTGLAGAERIVSLRRDAGRPLSSDEMARVVGAFLYYPWRIWDGAVWSHTVDPVDPPWPRAATPTRTARPRGGGDVLMFSYWIPDGTAGAGLHLANVRVTPSGYLIDAAPSPGLR